MQWVLILIFIFIKFLKGVSGMDKESLKLIQSNLKTNSTLVYNGEWNWNTVNNAFLVYYFRQNRFSDFIGDEPILVYPVDFDTAGVGNALGHYFEAIACADIIGLHFIGVSSNELTDLSLFWKAVPTIIIHPSPVPNRNTASDLIDTNRCGYAAPWSQVDATWLQRIDLIGHIYAAAINNLVIGAYATSMLLEFGSFDDSNKDAADPSITTTKYPLIPDAVVQMRCADILQHKGRSAYGFQNFIVYLRSIPDGVKNIYVVSEPLSQGQHGQTCDLITKGLVKFLSSAFENAFIGVRRSDRLEALVQLTNAPVLVCTASTFCLWPALLFNHTAYFPRSSLVTGGKEFPFADHFHWVSYPPLTTFGHLDLADSAAAAATVLATLAAPHQNQSGVEVVQHAPSEKRCRNGKHATGKWVLKDKQDVLSDEIPCCSWDSLVNPPQCGPAMARINGSYGGSDKYLAHSGGHSCGCLEDRAFMDRYDWVPDSCQLDEWNSAEFCALLGNRTILILGDSTTEQATSALINQIMWYAWDRLDSLHCQKQIIFGSADNLVLKTGIGMWNRGDHWLNWIARVDPDIVIMSAGPHVDSFDPSYKSIVEEIKSELSTLLSNRQNLTFVWKTQPPAGCTKNNTLIDKLPSQIPNYWEEYNVNIFSHYNYNSFEDMDAYAQAAFSGIANAYYLNLSPLYMRTDAHIHWYHKDVLFDCLHMCMPGPLSLFPIVLMNFLQQLVEEGKLPPSQR